MFTRVLNTAISATNIVVGTTYDIVSLGSTTQENWNTAAGTTSITYAVGDTFSAAAGGTGTGTISKISITQANITIDAYGSGTTYSDGNLVRFNNQTYEKQTLTPPSGVRVTFGANETATNRNGQLDFSQVIGSGQNNLAFNTTNGLGVDSPSAVNFGGRRFLRTNGSNALTKKVTQWTGLINTDGILTATADTAASDPTIELFNTDGSTMTLPTITGTVRFGMSIEDITATGTSGNPDTDTNNWKTSNINPTDESLLHLAGVDGVTESFQGSIAHYRPGAGVKVDVAGTLTINPEVNLLDSDSNKIATVKNGGILYVGLELTSPYDNTKRKTEGMAITGKRAQPIWYGGSANNSSIDVESGGTIVFTGATTKFPGGYYFADGSHVWINGLKHNPVDYVIEEKTIDPQTGVAVVDSSAAGSGVNVGTDQRLTFENRGYISWSDATDIRIDDFELIGGGELTFGNIPDLSSTNTLSGTTNGIVGYSAAGAKSPVLITQLIPKLSGQPPFVMKNTRLANSGNFKGGIALQSDGGKTSSGTVLGTALLTNASFGTELVLGSDKLLADGRNWGVALLGRDINVDIRDGLTGNTISGGVFFYRDYNVNDQRKDITLVEADALATPPVVEVSRDDTADRTFLSTLSSGKLSADHEVILKIVSVAAGVKKGGTSNDIRGIDRSFDITRTDATTLTYDPTNFGAAETTDVFNFYVTTDGTTVHTADTSPEAGQTEFTVSSLETDTIVCRILKKFNADHFIGDLRTKSGIEGEDTLDFVYWKEGYNPVFFTDFNVTNKTLGTITLAANTLPDVDYSSSTGTTADTPDELYDFIVQTKADSTEALATGVEYPDITTLAVSKDGTLLDIGDRSFETKTGTSKYEISNSALKVHTASFGGGTIFSGIKSTKAINLTNVNLATCVVETSGAVTNLPTTLPTGSDVTGTFTTAGNRTQTIDAGDDTLGLGFVVKANTTLSIYGKTQISDFAGIDVTATGASVVFPILFSNSIVFPSGVPSGRVIVWKDSDDSIIYDSGEDGTAGVVLTNDGANSTTQIANNTAFTVTFTSKSGTEYKTTGTTGPSQADIIISSSPLTAGLSTLIVPEGLWAPVFTDSATDTLVCTLNVTKWKTLDYTARNFDAFLNKTIVDQVGEHIELHKFLRENTQGSLIQSQGGGSYVAIYQQIKLSATTEANLPYAAALDVTGNIIPNSTADAGNDILEAGEVHLVHYASGARDAIAQSETALKSDIDAQTAELKSDNSDQTTELKADIVASASSGGASAEEVYNELVVPLNELGKATALSGEGIYKKPPTLVTK